HHRVRQRREGSRRPRQPGLSGRAQSARQRRRARPAHRRRPQLGATMRATALTLSALALLTASAAAQISSAPNTVPGTEANPVPVLNMPAPSDRSSADRFRHLPSTDLGNAMRIQLASAALYDFDRLQVQPRAEDYLQQTANLIFEKAKGPVRIECRSDRGA